MHPDGDEYLTTEELAAADVLGPDEKWVYAGYLTDTLILGDHSIQRWTLAGPAG